MEGCKVLKLYGVDVEFKGEVDFWDNGKFRCGILKEDIVLNVVGADLKFKGGEYISFHKNGVFHGGCLVDGVIIEVRDGVSSVKIKCSGNITYYDNGDVSGGCSLEDMQNNLLSIIPVEKGEYVKFYGIASVVGLL